MKEFKMWHESEQFTQLKSSAVLINMKFLKWYLG